MIRALAVLLFCAALARGQNTVTLNGTQYTLKDHPRTLLDGAGGVLDSRIKDPDGAGPLKAPKAVATNPAWVALGNSVAATTTAYQDNVHRYGMRTGVQAMQFATYWYADRSQTASRTAALYMLNHIEYYLPLVCVESTNDCVEGGTGYGISSYGIAYWIPRWIMAYELMRGEMTTAERQTFAAKMLNDRSQWGGIDGAPATNCTNPTVPAGTNITVGNAVWAVDNGSLTSLVVSNATLTITINGSTAGMQPGDQIRVRSGTTFDNFFDVVSIVSPTQFTAGYSGLGNATYTAPGMTVTYLKAYATTSSPVFGTTVATGDWVFANSNSYNLGIVGIVVDSTHAYLNGDMQPAPTDVMYYRAKDWSPGQCGVIWHVKHDSWTPPVITHANGSTLYPARGGIHGADSGHNLVYSALWGLHLVFLSLIDDDVNAAVRSKAELSAVYNFWYTNPYALAKSFWTGFHQTGSGYGVSRTHTFMPGTAIAIENSLVSPPNLMGGVWAKNLMVLDYANTFPNAQRSQMQWGQPDVSGGFGGMNASNMEGFTILAYWYRGSSEGSYANWWLQNSWASSGSGFGNAPGANSGFTAANLNVTGSSAPAWFFIFTDQAYPKTTLSGSPTTFAMNVSDSGTAGQRADALISRTGYLSTIDTLVNFHSQMIPEFDHNVFATQPSNYGSYKIFKGHYLLAEDYGLDFNDPAANGFTVGGTGSNYVEVGGTDTNLITGAFPIAAAMPRAGGNNNYAYGMADVTNVYKSAAALQRGYRHLVDFKKGGTQQFLVDYVDFRTSSGRTKKAYYHYPNKATTALVGDVLTTDNSHGNASRLLTKVLAPQPVLITADTTGASFRLDVCPSLNATTCDATNTQAEMLVVHMPLAGSTGSLPSTQLLSTIDSRFVGVAIGGSSPKVAVFARNGGSYTTSGFTTTHSGTAQILIAGITPTAVGGNEYTLTIDGTAVVQHQTVASDGTLYFEGGAGAYQLVAELPRPIIRFSPLANAAQYQTYEAAIDVTAGSPPMTWTISAGALPAGLTLAGNTGIIGGIPTASGSSEFTVLVTDAIGQTDTEVFTLDVTAAPAVTVITSSLTAKLGVAFSQSLAASGGGGTYTWSLLSGSLPAGFTLSSSGVVSGISSSLASNSAVIEARDQYSNVDTGTLTMQVLLVPATQVTGLTMSGRLVLR